MLDKRFLKEFETEIAEIFETGVIKAPVHLRTGNESNLVKIFDDYKLDSNDFSSEET